MSAVKPTVVLVHGSWHSPEHFRPLEAILNQHGYKTVGVWLPSMHYARLNQPPPTGLGEDIDAIRNTVLSELRHQPLVDILLLTHSSSSVPGSAAVESLDKKSRLASGHTNGIVSLLIMTGLLIPGGITPLGWAGNQVPPTVALSSMKSPVDANLEIKISYPLADPGPIALFYHDIDASEAEHYASLLKPQIWAVNLSTVPFTGYKVVPVSYLVCENDRALPAAFQRLMIEHANKEITGGQAGQGPGSDAAPAGNTLADSQRQSLAAIDGRLGEPGEAASEGVAAVPRQGSGAREISVQSIQSGHSPFLSHPEETAAWVRRCAGEEV